MLDHTALVNQARESREKLGYTVFTEGQNSFRLRGRAATLAGKPDLIAVKGQDVVIIDAKTGKPSPSHPAPGPHLSVRRSQSAGPVQRDGVQRTRHLPGCERADPGIGD